MNILVPDAWLREYLRTDATPKQIKDCVSLCGPSVERVNTTAGEIMYDIEVTGNRPDTMSVFGIAREASVILPRFGIKATLTNDLYNKQINKLSNKRIQTLSLQVTTDATINPRWTSVIFDNVRIKPSPEWLRKRLEYAGIRSLNNVIDITNYLLRAYGQPAHVFDYDRISDHTMKLRLSKKGETITTLDGKTHTLPGDNIVIEDGSGSLIDLCGIMGGENSAITPGTKRVVLFVQTYHPRYIRSTIMQLAHRTEAATLFEKGLDPEAVMPVFCEGIRMMKDLSSGRIASAITDIYPHPEPQQAICLERKKLEQYIGATIEEKEIKNILGALGCSVTLSKQAVTVTPPSFRSDLRIDVDIIEEVSRIYGYHAIVSKLPDTEPPNTYEEPILSSEQKIKQALKGWGYTEIYTYSMISKQLMETFGLSTEHAYRISNSLSSDWVYLRPTLLPSMLMTIKQNLSFEQDIRLFELSMTYAYRKDNLPKEESTLIVGLSGSRYRKIKGIAETLFDLFGISFPNTNEPASRSYLMERSLRLENFGQLGEVAPNILTALSIPKPVTILEISVTALLRYAQVQKHYVPIPKYPASFEDLAFVVPDRAPVGPMIRFLQNITPLVKDVTLFDSFKNIRTFHVTYQSQMKNLTAEDLSRARQKIISAIKTKFKATLKIA